MRSPPSAVRSGRPDTTSAGKSREPGGQPWPRPVSSRVVPRGQVVSISTCSRTSNRVVGASRRTCRATTRRGSTGVGVSRTRRRLRRPQRRVADTAPARNAEGGLLVKYVILIHSNPDPWGHPTQLYTPEGRALPPEQHEEMDRQFEALLGEISASGEFVTAEALADPASATLYGWSPQGHLATDGPYAEAKEQLAGFFIIDC